MDGNLLIRDLRTKKIVHRTKVTNASCRKVEKVMSGMLRNMSENYYIDDSEFDNLYKVKAISELEN